MAVQQGRADEGRSWLHRSATMWDRLDCPDRAVWPRFYIALAAFFAEEPSEAYSILQDLFAQVGSSQHVRDVAWLRMARGAVRWRLGVLRDAREDVLESVRAAQQVDEDVCVRTPDSGVDRAY